MQEKEGEEVPHCKGTNNLIQSLNKCLGSGNQGQEVMTSLWYLKPPPPPTKSLHPPRSPKRDFAQQVK